MIVVAPLLLNCRSPEIDTQFNQAIARGDLKKAEALLEQGADINHQFPEGDGLTTLMMASSANEASKGVAFLLEHGANPNLQADSGRTALHTAVMRGRLEHVETLLKSGADSALRDDSGRTAEDYALENGHEEIVELLRRSVEVTRADR
jgi:ankyrin repeat protein